MERGCLEVAIIVKISQSVIVNTYIIISKKALGSYPPALKGIYLFEHSARPHRKKVSMRVLSVE